MELAANTESSRHHSAGVAARLADAGALGEVCNGAPLVVRGGVKLLDDVDHLLGGVHLTTLGAPPWGRGQLGELPAQDLAHGHGLEPFCELLLHGLDGVLCDGACDDLFDVVHVVSPVCGVPVILRAGVLLADSHFPFRHVEFAMEARELAAQGDSVLPIDAHDVQYISFEGVLEVDSDGMNGNLEMV